MCGQVWESDRNLLQLHAMTHITTYINDLSTIHRAIDMDQFLALHQETAKGQKSSKRTEGMLLNASIVRRQLRFQK